MLDLSLSFIFSNIWTMCFLAVGVYNLWQRPDHKPIIHAAMIIATMFAVSHIVYVEWLVRHPFLVQIHYLYLALSAFSLIIILFSYIKFKGFIFYWPIKLTIILMLVEVVLDVLLHIDRNILALNGAATPNISKEDAWWLWSLRSVVFTMDNVIILVSMILPVSLVKRHHGIEETTSNNVVALNASGESRIVQLETPSGYRNLSSASYLQEIDQAYKRVDCLQDLINAMPDGKTKNIVAQYTFTASELITRQDQSKIDFIHSIHLLCDYAAKQALVPQKQLMNIHFSCDEFSKALSSTSRKAENSRA